MRGQVQREERRAVCGPDGTALRHLAEPRTHLSNATDSSTITVPFSGSETGNWLPRAHSLPVGQELHNGRD